MHDLKNRRAVITGAASGIGRAIALELARHGVHLWMLDVNEAGLAEVVSEANRAGVEAVAARCDLAAAEPISTSLDRLLDHWNYVDLLVNNAGVAYYGPAEEMTAQQWQWLLDINLRAPIRITHQLLPTLLARPEAHVLNVCSIAGLVAGGGRSTAYEVSKFGLVGFSEALRGEFGRRGLGVTALCPGPVQTNLYRAGISGRDGRPIPMPPRWVCTSEETVAWKAVRGIRRNRRLVLVSPMAHALFHVKRFAPWLLDLGSQWGRRRRIREKQLALTSAPAGPFTTCRPAGEDRQRHAA